ncbi:transposase [Acrocarpospora sp. B8E8]|uniref:transposase n=1 Tax=Acrocarpospora sp. B8E8 TaxID=3153572 RepID=UPI00325CC623
MHPLVVTIANTGEVVAILLREGNAGSNTAEDHRTVLRQAIAQIPARHRKNIIVRVDGAGATKELLTWIGAQAAEHGYDWRYSVGFDVTEPVRAAIVKVPATAWSAALTPEGKIRKGAHVADLTGLLALADGWSRQMKVVARFEPLHPRHRKQASAIEKKRGQRFLAVAHNLPVTTTSATTSSTATTPASNR